MRIYSRTGDRGTTGLPGGHRVAKSDPLLTVCGDLDELNAQLGLAASLTDDETLLEAIEETQRSVFTLSADLAALGGKMAKQRISQDQVRELESHIDAAEASLPPLSSFVFPGGTPVAAALHVARAICRRAERSLVALSETREVPAPYLALTNRLSDYLFVLARVANAARGVGDVVWSGDPGECGDA